MASRVCYSLDIEIAGIHSMYTKTKMFGFLTVIATFLLGLHSASVIAAPRQEASLLNATQVLSELRNAPDQNVPTWLLERAYAVAVVPNVIKVGLIFGGRRGSGTMVVREPDGSWSNPVFINLTGGSFGFQWGVQSTDVMLVFTSKASVEGLVGGKVTLGADASVAAGPVGRQTAAATDIGLNAQVYSYSRSKGLFLGVSLDGSAITIDNSANAAYYGKSGILASEITAPAAPRAPESAAQFIAALGGVPTAPTPAAPAAATPPPAPVPTTPNNTNANQANGLVTYPLEDNNPGSEPPL
ncbi:MAG: lipid-binding SYLF domain-containing protein [Steroidobacteraceae bacterium]